MSAWTTTTFGPFDPSLTASSARAAPSVSSRPDEAFWQGVFDRAETLGLATADAAVPNAFHGAGENQTQTRQGEPSRREETEPRQADDKASVQSSGTTSPSASSMATGEAAKTLPTTPWSPVLHAPQAARWRAAQSYGLASAEPIALPQAATTQAPPIVNATLVTLPNGELKLYLRAAGLSAGQALEAAALADLPWPSGQAPDITEVVLNGQTIYTRGVDQAPSFILTC